MDNYKLFIVLWLMISASLVYWDINKGYDKPLSACHKASVYMFYDYKVGYERPMCVECKLFCEIKKP
tara:strand:+ start:126 stop:326 length:201 start_codon:yes stop_codon:yes gene_type:complete